MSKWLSGGLVLALVAYAPGFQEDGPKWLVLLLLCAFAWGGLSRDRVNLALASFVAWAALSLLWSPDRGPGVEHMLGIALFAGLFLIGRSGKVHPAAIPAALAVTLIYWAAGLDNGGVGNPNFLAEFIVVALPHVYFLDKRLRWPAVIGGLALLSIVDSRTGLFAVWLAGAGWLGWKRSYMLAAIWLLIPVNLAILGPLDVTGSVHARVELWINTAAMWLDSPLLGVGAGGFDYSYPKWEAVHLRFFPDWGFYHPITVYAGAAHNEPLQLLAEFGVVGFALAGWFLCEALRRKTWKPVHIWSLGLAGAACLIGFPLQTPCTLALIALTLGAAVGKGEAWGCLPALLGRTTAVVVFGVGAALMIRTLEAQWIFQGVIVFFRENPAAAVAANVRAYEAAPWDFKFRYQMYPTLAKASHQPNVIVKPSAFEKAWAISVSASPYSRYLKAVRSDIDGR